MQGRVEGCRGIADATLNAGTGCCQPTEKYFEVVFASEYGEELSARVEPASSPLAAPRTNDLSAFRAAPSGQCLVVVPVLLPWLQRRCGDVSMSSGDA